jgi:hypothetical protein
VGENDARSALAFIFLFMCGFCDDIQSSIDSCLGVVSMCETLNEDSGDGNGWHGYFWC